MQLETKATHVYGAIQRFFIKDHDVPKDLSIHLLANTTAEKISSDEVRSMIIQVSGSPESYVQYSQIPNIFFP